MRAFYGLSFPIPEDGIVTVVYPIMFVEGGSGGSFGPQPARWQTPQIGTFPANWARNSWIGAIDDKWRTESSDSLAKLQKNAEESIESRRAREAFINGLLVRGRFDDAFREATAYVAMDPDRPTTHELFARAAAAVGKNDMAVVALDTQADIEPTNAEMHKRAARAFEAAGDETRACAHWRSTAELRPNDEDIATEAMRCRARLFGERSEVLSQMASMKNTGKRITALRDAIEQSSAPAYQPGRPAGERISVAIACADGMEGCPNVVLIDPTGRIMTTVTPGSGRSGSSWIALPSAMEGTSRVLVTGGLESAQGKVEIHLDNSTKKFDVRGGNGARSVATLAVVGF
jgi:Ca-activated chloride channel family protein